MASSCTHLLKPAYRVLQVNIPPSPTSLEPFLKPCMGDIDGLNVENEPFRSAGFSTAEQIQARRCGSKSESQAEKGQLACIVNA
jgi:hypothetical protein